MLTVGSCIVVTDMTDHVQYEYEYKYEYWKVMLKITTDARLRLVLYCIIIVYCVICNIYE